MIKIGYYYKHINFDILLRIDSIDDIYYYVTDIKKGNKTTTSVKYSNMFLNSYIEYNP